MFGSQFAPDVEIIDEAYTLVMRDVLAPADIVAKLKADFTIAMREGVARIENIFIDALKKHHVVWEDYDIWKDRFLRSGNPPYMWREIYHRIEFEKCKEHMLTILGHYIMMNVYSIRNYNQGMKHLIGKQRVLFYPYIDPSHCSVEESIRLRWYRGELQGRPPFFPGDRCSVDLGRQSHDKATYARKCAMNPECPVNEEERQFLIHNYLGCTPDYQNPNQVQMNIVRRIEQAPKRF